MRYPMCNIPCDKLCDAPYPGRNYICPPPSPHFWSKGVFQGRGVGVYILRPHAAGILYAPPFYTPPTPRRVFSGVGGVGVYKIRPRTIRTSTQQICDTIPTSIARCDTYHYWASKLRAMPSVSSGVQTMVHEMPHRKSSRLSVD